MMISVPRLLSKDQVTAVSNILEQAGDAWIDGRRTAGYQGAQVKQNQQIDEHSSVARECQAVVLEALERNPLFISAALPNRVYPPMFNRYDKDMHFGAHVDGGIRIDPRTGNKFRTDISATLFLNNPDDYDGGELRVMDSYGVHSVKLAAGDLVLYPAASLHEVTPLSRGRRLACFFWVQSLIRDDAQRSVLYDLDTAIQRLNQTGADGSACTTLVGCYHNLLRQWGET